VSLCPKDGEDADTLLKNADIAMYGAKDAGRDAIRFFTQEMNAQVQDRVALEQALRVALERDELHLVFQPQIDAATGRVVGAEALLRWRHPELGLVPPARFIPVTEELGLIGVIGEWVLREACRQAADWRAGGLGDVVIAVNVSARQLAEPDLPERVMTILAETGLPPHLLELELTESMLMGAVERSEIMLHNLKQIGVTLSLDDFGTGYSSFAYLRRFPIDTVKIDQTFVRDMGEGASNAESIVSAIIAMAHSLKMRVVAEGVETPLQQRQLVRHGCDVLQGYLLGRPSLADQFDHRPRSAISAEE
jgi:EAL domain-containing protein (putative c-di-GMP-specific phosphodiesterase class I)